MMNFMLPVWMVAVNEFFFSQERIFKDFVFFNVYTSIMQQHKFSILEKFNGQSDCPNHDC